MTDLVTQHHRTSVPLMPSVQEWAIIKEQASVLVKSGFLPKGIDTPEKAIAIALKGREMGIPMMQAFSHIAIVQGKPCISAELMLAQIRRNVPGAKIEYLDQSDTLCRLRSKRPGEAWQEFSFSIDDAKKANLLTKGGTWSQYPSVMLQWRAVSKMARASFPDAIMGCSYTPEEMGALVDEDGEVIDVPDHGTKASKAPNSAPLPPTTNMTFNARDKADIEWLKIQPDVQMLDQVTQKKVALELHGHDKATLPEAIKRIEAAFLAEIKDQEDPQP